MSNLKSIVLEAAYGVGSDDSIGYDEVESMPVIFKLRNSDAGNVFLPYTVEINRTNDGPQLTIWLTPKTTSDE